MVIYGRLAGLALPVGVRVKAGRIVGIAPASDLRTRYSWGQAHRFEVLGPGPLAAVACGRAVLLGSWDLHAAWASPEALRRAGLPVRLRWAVPRGAWRGHRLFVGGVKSFAGAALVRGLFPGRGREAFRLRSIAARVPLAFGSDALVAEPKPRASVREVTAHRLNPAEPIPRELHPWRGVGRRLAAVRPGGVGGARRFGALERGAAGGPGL